MGNAIDKKSDIKARVISRMIRNFLKDEGQLDDEKSKFERKKNMEGSRKKSDKIKDKNIIGCSMVIAEEIIKKCLFRVNDVNTQIYSSLIVYDNLDQDQNIEKKIYDYKISKISCFSNLEENEELSNYCQLKSCNNLFFPEKIENKFNNSLAKLFEDFKISSSTVPSQNLKTESLQSEIITPSRSRINNFNSPIKPSDASLELVSLQEYLKRESDRLKNDQDYLNYKNRKESLIMKEQRDEQLMNEILNMKTTSTPSSLIQQFQLQKKNKSVNLLKNKNFVNSKIGKNEINNFKKDSINSLHQHSVQLNKNYKQSNSLKNFYVPAPGSKRNTRLSQNIIFNSPSNKSTSKSKFLNITNSTVVNTCPDSNRFNKKIEVPKLVQSRNFPDPKIKLKLNFSPKKDSNPISPQNLSENNTINIRERERERERGNQTLTTKTTSRPSSYNRQGMKSLNMNIMPSSTKANQKNENIFKIDLTRKGSGQNFKNNNLINERYEYDDMENLNVDLREKSVIPQNVASIKIDIRELLQEGDDRSEDQSILKTQENYNNKSYSEILPTENYQNASNVWNSKELEDLIIVKQTVDKNGRIVV